MSFNPFTVIKSLLIKKEGVLTPDSIEIVPSGTADTKTTIESSQTVNRTITLPDATDTLATLSQVTTVQTNLDNHINNPTDAHDASAISNVPAGTIVATDVQTAINELDTDIQAHINESTGAHAASAISNIPSGNLVATDVQGALNEIQTELDAVVIVANDAATKELDNLTTTALNVDLLPDADGTRDLGSSSLEFAETHSKSLNRTTAGNLTISVASGNLNLSPSGDIDANNNLIVNVANPTAGSHAANKEYVDSLAAGFDPKAAVRVASTADVGGSYATTPSNGQLTGAATSIDGVTLTIGDRVLLKDQTDLKQNGIYEYTASGEFTRATDSDGSPASEVSSGNFTFATQGTLGSASGFVLLGNGILTLNVDDLDWTQSSGGASGASRFLDNLLSPTAINQNLLPGTTATIDLGSDSLKFKDAYLQGQLRVNGNITTDAATSLTLSSNGNLVLQSGTSGPATLKSQNNSSGSTTQVNVTSGDASGGAGSTGNVVIKSGNSSVANGGDTIIDAGTGNLASTQGKVQLSGRYVEVIKPLNLTQGQTAIPLSNQQSLTIPSSGNTEGLVQLTASDSSVRNILTAASTGLPQAPNLIIGGDAEGKLVGSTSIFTPYADAAGTVPVDGIGGSPNVTSSVTISSPLSGSKSYELIKDAANRQGQGWSILDVNVPLSMRARVLSIKFDYIVDSGTFAAGTNTTDSDVTIWIYDIGGLRVIQPSSYKLLSNSTTVVDQFQAEFQTPIDMSAFRLIAHIGSTSASAYTLKLDNIVVSPSEYVFGTPISDWQNFPSVAAGTLIKAVTTNPTYGTIQTNKAQYRRNGDSLDIRWDFVQTTAGGAGSGDYLFDISQLGLSIDTTKVEANTASTTVQSMTSASIGKVTFRDSSNAAVGYASVYNSTQIKAFGLFTPGNSNGPWTAAGLGRFSLTPLSISLEAKIPIAGWSSSVQMADQTSTRVVDVSAYKSGGAITANTTIGGYTVEGDTHAALNPTTGVYTIPVAGDYLFTGSVGLDSGSPIPYVRVNGVDAIGGASAGGRAPISGLLKNLKVGDTVTLLAATGGTSNTSVIGTRFGLSRISGPSQIAASEKILFSGYVSANQALTANVTNLPVLAVKDTHAAWNGSLFTCPLSGDYQLNFVAFATSGGASMKVYRNGSLYGVLQGVSTSAWTGGAVVVENCLAGDTISVRGDSAVTIVGGASTAGSKLSIARIPGSN